MLCGSSGVIDTSKRRPQPDRLRCRHLWRSALRLPEARPDATAPTAIQVCPPDSTEARRALGMAGDAGGRSLLGCARSQRNEERYAGDQDNALERHDLLQPGRAGDGRLSRHGSDQLRHYNDSTYWTCNLSKYGSQSWYCRGCKEYAPGYYPNGISENGGDVITFLPGRVLHGWRSVDRRQRHHSHGEAVRQLARCSEHRAEHRQLQSADPNRRREWRRWRRCVDVAPDRRRDVLLSRHGQAGHQRRVGCARRIRASTKFLRTDLTCDGSTPPSYLNLASALDTNVMLAQCTANGSYWDTAGDTTDSVGSVRGLLMFMDHRDTASPQLQGSGTLAYTGTLYFHSSSYATIFQIPGGTTNGTLIWGNVVTDQMQITGSGALTMALNPAMSTPILKVSLLK